MKLEIAQRGFGISGAGQGPEGIAGQAVKTGRWAGFGGEAVQQFGDVQPPRHHRQAFLDRRQGVDHLGLGNCFQFPPAGHGKPAQGKRLQMPYQLAGRAAGASGHAPQLAALRGEYGDHQIGFANGGFPQGQPLAAVDAGRGHSLAAPRDGSGDHPHPNPPP